MGMYSGTIKGITIDGICFEQLYIFVTNNKIKKEWDIEIHDVINGYINYYTEQNLPIELRPYFHKLQAVAIEHIAKQE